MLAVWFGNDPIARTDNVALVSDMQLAMMLQLLAAELTDDMSGTIVAAIGLYRWMVADLEPLGRFKGYWLLEYFHRFP